MERLIIRNFGPVKDIDIEIKKMTVFIGEQGVGKSTLAKLITRLRDVMLPFSALPEKEINIDLFLNDYDLSSFLEAKTYISYHSQLGYQLIFEKGKFHIEHEGLDAKDLNTKISKTVRNHANKAMAHIKLSSDQGSTIELWKKNGSFLNAALASGLYIPSERSLAAMLSKSLASIILSNTPLPEVMLKYMSFFEKAKRQFPLYKIDFLNLTFSTTAEKEFIRIGNKEIAFKDCSSGLHSVIPLLMVVDYCLETQCFDTLALEEPELNLFPTNQAELLQFIITRFNRLNEQKADCNKTVILTTHSPYLLSALNLAALAGKINTDDPEIKSEIEKVVPENARILPQHLAVYSLGTGINDDCDYCKSVINKNTGLIEENYLDTVSHIINKRFAILNRCYIKTFKETRTNDQKPTGCS